MFPGMFFWPEEDTLASEHIDNAWLSQLGKVHIRYEDPGISALLLNTTPHFAVYFDVQRLTTMRTCCFDNNRKRFVVLSS
jgi:hypothetical protein